jgi:hypothetical protein
MTADKKLLLIEVDILSVSLETRNKSQRRKDFETTSQQWENELMLSALQQQSYGKSLKIHRKWLCRTLFVEVPQKINRTLED